MNVGSFSTGISWEYYDKVVKNIGFLKTKLVDVDQNNNPLFVKPKYQSFKEEILNYKYINIEHYKTEILPKAEAFHETKLVKSMKAVKDYSADYSRYGIVKGDPINKERLISMILYTDYTDHSSDFSSTFRSKTKFETFSRTKQRHANYYWMSKLLRETVAIHGTNNGYIGPGAPSTELGGPFFCGMSMVMTMPQFAIKLFSPTSTSCHIEVALTFAGRDGLILEFVSSEDYDAAYLRGLDLSWISRYKEEDER